MQSSFKTLLMDQSRIYGDAVFIVTEAYPENASGRYENSTAMRFKEIQYREMPEQVGKACNAFVKLGITKGDKVNVHLSNCNEYFVSLLALACIGAVMVPTDTQISTDEWKYIVNQAKAKLVVTEPDYIDSLNKIRHESPTLENVLLVKTRRKREGFLLFSDLLSESSTEIPSIDISSGDDLAIYYAKFNGQYEGVVLTQANYLNWAENIAKTLKYTQLEHVFEARPISNPLNLISSALASFITGNRCFMSDHFYKAEWIHQVGFFGQYFQKNMGRGTFGFLTAEMVRQVVNQEYNLRDSKNPLKLLIYQGELNLEEVEYISKRFLTKLSRFFGMPECAALFSNPVSDTLKPESIGKPNLGIKVSVIDENGAPLPPGKTGRLSIIGKPGDDFFKGYYQNENKTSEAIKGVSFITDINARYDEEGYYYIIK